MPVQSTHLAHDAMEAPTDTAVLRLSAGDHTSRETCDLAGSSDGLCSSSEMSICGRMEPSNDNRHDPSSEPPSAEEVEERDNEVDMRIDAR